MTAIGIEKELLSDLRLELGLGLAVVVTVILWVVENEVVIVVHPRMIGLFKVIVDVDLGKEHGSVDWLTS